MAKKQNKATITDFAERIHRKSIPETIHHIMEVIDEWRASKHIVFDPPTGTFSVRLPRSCREEPITSAEVIDDIQHAMELPAKLVGYREGPFRVALRYWIQEQRDASLTELINKLCGHGTTAQGEERRIVPVGNWDPIRKLVRAGLHNTVVDVDTFENHVCVFAHWIWCSKRLLLGEQDHYQLAIFLTGRNHNAGKSAFMRRICKAVHGVWYRETTLPQLFEKFGWRPLTTHVLLGVDDADRGSDKQVATFKRVISSEYLTGRAMQSMASPYPRRTATLMCTSNERIQEVITDTTGARRLWEFPFVDTRITSDDNWDTRLSYNDILAAFQCVDELDDMLPIYKRFDHIATVQRTLKAKTLLEQFFEECVRPTPENVAIEQTGMPLKPLKKALSEWAREAGRKNEIPNIPDIVKELDGMGIACNYNKNSKTYTALGIELIDA